MADGKKVTLKGLIAICSSFGLKTYGTKELLLSRIKKYEDEIKVLQSTPTNDEKNDQATVQELSY